MKSCLLFLILLIIGSCGAQNTASNSSESSVALTTTIKGVAMLGPVTEGTVNAYSMLPDGTPDTTQVLATSQTDKDGSYALEIPQAQLQEDSTALVIQLSSGTYVEEGSGKTVVLGAPMNTVLPMNDAYSDTGAVVQAAISPFTNIAAQRYMNEAGKAMIDKAIAGGVIPAEFGKMASDFVDKGFDPNFLKDNPDFKAAFEGARRDPVFKDSGFRGQMVKMATDSNFAVSQAFGLTNVIGVIPDNPAIGGKSQEGTAYMVGLAALSLQASKAGVDSIAMMQAMGHHFAQNGSFNVTAGAPPISVFDATGKPISMPPPNFQDFSKNFTGISDGSVKLPGNFMVFAPAIGADGVPLPPSAGGAVPAWGGAFKAPTFMDKPSFAPPAGWTAGSFLMPPLPPGWAPPAGFVPPPDFVAPAGFVPPPNFQAPQAFILPPGFVPPANWAPPTTFMPSAGFAPPPGFQAPSGFVPPTGFVAPVGFQAPPNWTPPADFRAPAGFAPPEGFKAPEGWAPPVGFAPQAGFVPPPGFVAPIGFAPAPGFVPPPGGFAPPPGGFLPPPGGFFGGGGGGGDVPPNIFMLSSVADLLTGTPGNEFYNAVAIVGSFDSADSIEAGIGMDTLSAKLNASVTPVKITGVESMFFEAQATATVNLTTADVPMMMLRNSDSIANDLTISNAPLIQMFDVINNSAGAGAFTVTVKNVNLAGPMDVANLSLNSVTTASITLAPVSAGSGYEMINIRSDSPIKNGLTTDLILDDGAGTSLTTVNFVGMAALDIDFTPTTITTVGANMMVGALDVQFATGNAQNVLVATGSGNDTIDVQGYTALDFINAGTGSGDKLVLTSTEAAAVGVQANVIGVEVIGLSGAAGAGASYTLSNFGASSLVLDGTATAGALTVTLPTGTSALNLDASTGGGLLTVNIAGAATTDVLNMTMGSSSAGNAFGQAMTFTGTEAINLTTQGGAVSMAAFTNPSAAGTQQLNVLGTQNLTFTGQVTAEVIDASGLSGTAILVLSSASGTAAATTITGGLNADILFGSTGADIITGGAGADFITNTVTGAAVTAGDTLTGGIGIDTFTLIGSSANAANYAGSPSVTDYVLGTDLIRISGGNSDYSAGLATGAGAAGSTASAEAVVIQTVAQNAVGAAVGGTANIIKLTTAVAFSTDIQGTFNAAIGTATITGLTANTVHAVTLYDSTNLRMVILEVNPGGIDTVVGTGDTVRLIGVVSMSSTDYGNLTAANFAAFL